MKLFASMWHKAEWMGHLMRLELTRVGLLVKLANHYTTKDALKALELDKKHLKKAEGCICRKVNITIKMKIIVWIC